MRRRSIHFAFLLAFVAMGAPAWAQLGQPPPVRGAVLVSGRLVAQEQFRVMLAHIPNCWSMHLHAASGTSVQALDGTVLTEPSPTGCGFGWKRFHPVFVTDLPDADFDGLPDAVDPHPDTPDGDSDGVPDGNEDGDGDGLTDAFEFWVTRTDPLVADSNGNGINDRTEHALARWERQHAKIPVVINLYRGSGATRQHAEEAIALANRILSRARLSFELVKVVEDATAGDDGSGGGTAEDGSFTLEEGDKVVVAGIEETRNLPGKKGFKVSFAAPGGVETGTTTPGISYHRHGSVICEQRASTKRTAATIAHELFHVLTLSHPAPGSAEDTPGNIMTPSNGGRDDFVDSSDADKGLENVSLTPGQIGTIIEDNIIPTIGNVGVRRSPAVKKEYESGLALDALGDHGAAPAWLDLAQLRMNSDEDSPHVHALLSLAATLPDTGDHIAVYRLMFDRDADVGTGSTVYGMPGVDVEVQILLLRSDADGLRVASRVRYPPASIPDILLPYPDVLPVLIRADDANQPDRVESDLIELRIDKAALGLSADDVPVTVVAQAGEYDVVADAMDLLYERTRWQRDPTFHLGIEQATRGSVVPFMVEGLASGAPFELRFDEDVLMSGTLDGSGHYSGSFAVPANADDGPHFLSVVDDSARFAFSELVLQDEVLRDGFEPSGGMQ